MPLPAKSEQERPRIAGSAEIRFSSGGGFRIGNHQSPRGASDSTGRAGDAARTGAVSQPAPTQAALRAAFTATEPVWVSVKSDGTRAYSGTLEARERKEFDAARKMTVLVGNAGGVEITLNGKPVGPIGAPGQIRLLVLTPNGAHVVPRTPPISEDSPAPAAAAVARP